MGLFSRPKSTPPTDEELYTNLNAAIFTYIETLNDYKQGENQIVEVGEMSIQEVESTYQIVVDAALSSLNHPTRDSLKLKLLESIPKDLLKVRKNLADSTYLPPPSPPKFSGWIQGELNNTFPVGKYISDDAYGYLMNLIASAFVQGNPPRNMNEITEYENDLITLLFVGTHKGFESASNISDLRAQANRHLAQIFALTLILGIKFSSDNNLKAEG
jgi:hypothetical protein